MHVLITGAAGFVGAHLIRELKKNPDCQLMAWARDAIELEQIDLPQTQRQIVDITDANAVRQAIDRQPPQVVYHLAAQSSVGLSWKLPALTCSVNIVGTIHLLEALKEKSKETVCLLIGSAEQYGVIRAEDLPIRETQPLQGSNPYSISKITQEQLAELYQQQSALSIIRVRAFNHIGPGQNTTFVIPDWCSQVVAMEEGRQSPVLRVGNVSVRRDFTDVRDIVHAYVALAQQGKAGEVYNVGSGQSHSLEEVIEIIFANSRSRALSYEVDRSKLRPVDVPELKADITKLQQTIDWHPQYTIEQSIQDILQSMRIQAK